MSNPVDDVFGGGGAPLPPVANPLVRLRWMLALSWVLTLIGPCCFTGVPGGGLAIWVWTRADESLALVENGALPAADGAPMRLVRNVGFAAMLVSLALTVFQLVLFGYGVYDGMLQAVLTLISELSLRFG